MNLIDLYDDNAEADRKYHRELARIQASDPCEDDCEVFASALSVMPDESNNHLIHTGRAIDVMIERAMCEGVYES